MLTFEALAQFDESAGSLVATVALKKTRASLTLLAMTSFGRRIFNGHGEKYFFSKFDKQIQQFYITFRLWN